MLRSFQFSLLILLVAVLAGCGETKTNSKAVAVLNMETVAMMTGADLSMQKAVQERNKQLSEGLSEFQAKIEEAWKKKQKEFGDKPTEEQRKQLDQYLRSLRNQSMEARDKTRQNLMQFQQELANKFRELVSPISLEVAKEHGYSIVIIENPSLIAFDTAINITDLVVERMKQTKGESSGLPAVENKAGSSPESKLPELKQPTLPPLAPAQPKTKLKLPEIKTETEKKDAKETKQETPQEKSGQAEKKKSEKPAPSAKSASKPETKTEQKPKPEKPAADKSDSQKTTESSEKK